jgi:hypothetical protein
LNGSRATVSAADSAARGGAGRPLSSRHAVLIVGLAVLVTLPLLFPPVLPLTDLAGHIGRYAVQLDAGRDPQLAQWYSFSWQLLPNLGADLLIEALGPLIGLEPAVRAIVILAVFLQALGILATSRALHGRVTPFAIAALALIYGHSTLFGFLNYMLALGLLWCSLALWIAMSRGADARHRWPVFALVAMVIWTCHLVGWGLLCIAVGSHELMRQLERQRSLFRALVASVLPLSWLLVPWLVKLATFAPSAGAGKTEGWFLMAKKGNALAGVLRDQWHVFDVASVALIGGLIVGSWLTKWTRLNRAMMLAAAITAVFVIVVPQRLLGSFFADQRLIEPALLFALLAIRLSGRGPSRLPRVLFAAALLFTGARLAGNVVSLWQLGNRSANALAVLKDLPRNAQLVTFRALRCPPPKRMFDRWTHLAGYAIARRHAFANDQWQVPGGQLLRVHNPAAGRFQADDSQIAYEVGCFGKPGLADKAAQVPGAIPYLWVLWSGQPGALDGWEPIARNGGSVLYRRLGEN